MVYLDYAATAPMKDVAIEAYRETATKYYGNSSSLHEAGWLAEQLLENAREIIAQTCGVSKEGIYFTGSGTEGNLIAILSIVGAQKGKHIITSAAEHTSVHAAMNALEKQGYEITKVPMNADGQVNMELIEQAIRPTTALISMQNINPETGVIQPVDELIQIAQKHRIKTHIDCVQSFMKLKLKGLLSRVDGATISAHKVGGPKGLGAIYLNPRCQVSPIFPGLTHERGIRGGTIDIPAIVAFASVVQSFQEEEDFTNSWQLREEFIRHLDANLVEVIESKSSQLPTIIGCVAKGIEGQLVMLKLSEKGYYISTGSACDIGHEGGTKAIEAMGYDLEAARGFFRISFHPSHTKAIMRNLSKEINQIIQNR